MRRSRTSVAGAMGFAAALSFGPLQAEATFLRGDVDQDGGITVTDAIQVIQFLFFGGALPCSASLEALTGLPLRSFHGCAAASEFTIR